MCLRTKIMYALLFKRSRGIVKPYVIVVHIAGSDAKKMSNVRTVDVDIRVKGSHLEILGWSSKRDELLAVFGEGEWLEAQVHRPKKFKTNPQLGYLWGCLAPRLLKALRDMGWNLPNKEAAVDFIKDELNFVEELTNESTGEVRSRSRRSIAGASMEDVAVFIDNLVMFLTVDCQVTVPSPEEYKKWKKA